MDSSVVSEITVTSTLLGYGGISPRLKTHQVIFGAILGALVLLVIFLWLGLRASFLIPAEANFLAITTPKNARRLLGPPTISQLPPVWRFALSSDSSLPIVLGSYRDQEVWRHFAIVPRWQQDPAFSVTNKGLLSLLKEAPFPHEDRRFGYHEAVGWWASHPFSDYIIWSDIHLFFAQASSTDAWNLQPFFVRGRSNILTTDLPLVAPASTPSPTANDVSIILPSDALRNAQLRPFLEQIHLGDWPLSQLGVEPTQINLQLDQNLKLQYSDFIFSSPLDEKRLKLALASLGISKKKVIQIPDGTIVVEQKLIDNAADFQGKKMDVANHRSVFIMKNEIRVGNLPPNDRQDSAPQSCPNQTVILARLSGKVVGASLKNLGILMQPSPAVQFGAYRGKLILCFEQ